jgi:hypothetical protein
LCAGLTQAEYPPAEPALHQAAAATLPEHWPRSAPPAPAGDFATIQEFPIPAPVSAEEQQLSEGQVLGGRPHILLHCQMGEISVTPGLPILRS